jgi:tRNA (guanine37-N1)-methyltransferase
VANVRINVITLFPQMMSALTQEGVVARALKQGLVDLRLWNPRDFTADRHRSVDDRPYGGGPGMVMLAEPLAHTINAARQACRSPARVIHLSPQGQRFDQRKAQQLLEADQDLVLLAGRYEGIDQRLLDRCVDEELSLGDFVVSGGELAAMVVIDAMTRLLPGALGHADSAAQDSFIDGLLDCPHFTRPECWEGQQVPAVLLSGDHAAIRRWRCKQALGVTLMKRPDLLEGRQLTEEQQQLLDEFLQEHNNGD